MARGHQRDACEAAPASTPGLCGRRCSRRQSAATSRQALALSCLRGASGSLSFCICSGIVTSNSLVRSWPGFFKPVVVLWSLCRLAGGSMATPSTWMLCTEQKSSQPESISSLTNSVGCSCSPQRSSLICNAPGESSTSASAKTLKFMGVSSGQASKRTPRTRVELSLTLATFVGWPSCSRTSCGKRPVEIQYVPLLPSMTFSPGCAESRDETITTQPPAFSEARSGITHRTHPQARLQAALPCATRRTARL
mmetsp:Transcript_27830/g.88449  ORF Transcript_27830/g.88449 Transcript_27830/m.88449 type:complete len:252 (+) Transcript_27830:57-812(+)